MPFALMRLFSHCPACYIVLQYDAVTLLYWCIDPPDHSFSAVSERAAIAWHGQGASAGPETAQGNNTEVSVGNTEVSGGNTSGIACWAAGDGRIFQATAIIANPPVYGHLHVAEKLGVPVCPWALTGVPQQAVRSSPEFLDHLPPAHPRKAGRAIAPQRPHSLPFCNRYSI